MNSADSASAAMEAELVPLQHSPSLEISGGGTAGDLSGATSFSGAVVVPAGRNLGLVGRFEYSHLEQQGDAIFFATTAWTDMSVATLAARLAERHGDLSSFAEAGLGYGWVRSRLLFTPYGRGAGVVYGQLDFTDNRGYFCPTFGLGVSWHPGGAPVGVLGEARMLTFVGPESAHVVAWRVGLALGG